MTLGSASRREALGLVTLYRTPDTWLSERAGGVESTHLVPSHIETRCWRGHFGQQWLSLQDPKDVAWRGLKE